MGSVKNALRQLDRLEFPVGWADVEHRRPSRLPGEPRVRRLSAAVVAFAVFAAAGGLVWAAFRPSADRIGTGGEVPRVVVTFTETGPRYDVPTALMTIDGVSQTGQIGSFEWCDLGGCSISDAATPVLEEFVRVPLGSEILIEGTATSVTGELGDADRFPFETIEPLDLSGGVATLDVPAGPYSLSFQASWPQGTVPFYFGIEITPRVSPSQPPGTLVTVPDLVGLDRSEATTMLEDVGLTVEVTTSPSEEVAEGIVLWQNPPPGSRVEPGTRVLAVVSAGPSQDIPCIPQTQKMEQSETKLGQWLLGLLERAGAPEGWEITRGQITEPPRAGEFFLQLPQYAGRFDLSVFAEPPDPSIGEIGEIPVLARSSEWTLHAGWVRKGFQAFIAAGPDVWITVHVFPKGERIGNHALVEWFHRVVDEVNGSPPPPECVSGG